MCLLTASILPLLNLSSAVEQMMADNIFVFEEQEKQQEKSSPFFNDSAIKKSAGNDVEEPRIEMAAAEEDNIHTRDAQLGRQAIYSK